MLGRFIFACPDLLLLPGHLILAVVRGREVSQMDILWFSRQQSGCKQCSAAEGMTQMTFAEAEEHTQG